MLEQLFVWSAFGIAVLVCLISLFVAFFWLPRKMDRALGNALRTLATAVETKDSRTLGHAERVAEVVVAISEELKLPKSELKWVRYAALLRDIGKAGVPYRILNKQESLTEGELRVVRGHAKEGALIVGQVPILSPLQEIILHHHERWDGSGYPDGLAGVRIPLASRIIGLVDDFEAMVSERPYHAPMDEEEAMQKIRDGAGTLYDPAVVEAFLRIAPKVRMKVPAGEAQAA